MRHFNQQLAENMYGVSTEAELRKKIVGTRSDLTDLEVQCLKKYVNMFEAPTYLEVGVYFGGTFTKMLKHLNSNFSEFKGIGVDLFENLILELAKEPEEQTHDTYNKWNILNVAYKSDLEDFFKENSLKNFELLKGNSDTMISQITEKLNVCFLDGNHTYLQTKKDAEACLSVTQPGTYIILHNASDNIEPDPQYIQKDGGPWKVCEELKNNQLVKFVELVDRCGVFKRV